MVAQFLHENGARSSDLGYQGFPKHCCTSRNDVIVHGIPRDDEFLQDGDIINIDLTSEYKGFHGDASQFMKTKIPKVGRFVGCIKARLRLRPWGS